MYEKNAFLHSGSSSSDMFVVFGCWSTEMDALFNEAPIFVPGTAYARAQDRHIAEQDMIEGT